MSIKCVHRILVKAVKEIEKSMVTISTPLSSLYNSLVNKYIES